MARIRTVKPDFWEDDAIGALSREARLLFVATWNLADDEGLLRWSAPYLKASVFMYDEDLGSDAVEAFMGELVDADLVFPYSAGKARQRLAYIVNFRKHQKINRPQPSKLTPPPIHADDTLQMYLRRDKGLCHLCHGEVPTDAAALAHDTPRAQGGTDFPSNVALAHGSCVDTHRGRAVEKAVGALSEPFTEHSVNGSLTEGKGKEGKGSSSSCRTETRDDAPLPPPLAILRSKLNARRLTVRWDKLTGDQRAQIEALIGLHGDEPLVKAALNSYRPNNPPVFAQAWIETWAALPAPGEHLRLAPEPPCPERGHNGTTRHCIECASEAKAADR